MSEQDVFQKEQCGIRIQKDADGQWYFGRPKGPAIWWEKCELGDLLNLGICGDDLEGVVVNHVYRAGVAAELRDTDNDLAVSA